ncbi:MAG: hypothetical protein GY780_01780, partial [bacterium]|nr:hypothetical protein [bacterium]
MRTPNAPTPATLWSLVTIMLVCLSTASLATANPVYSDTTGAVISFSNVEYTEINMVNDNEGGQWLVWVDEIISPSQLRFQHIDAAGNYLLASGGEILNPSTIFPYQHYHLNPTMLADGNGGVFVAFRDSVETNEFPATVIQHLDYDGNKLWGSGIGWWPDSSGQTRHSEVQMVLADNGGIAVVWKDELGANPGLYAQLMDADGYQLWNPYGVWIDQTPYHVTRPRIAWMPTSKLAVAWQEGRVEAPYAIYWQVVESDGTTQLGVGGDPIFIDSSIEYTDHEVVLSTGGNFIVAARARELSGSETGIFVVAQKFGRNSLNAFWAEPNGIICSSRSVGPGKDIKDIHLLTGVSGGANVFYLWSENVFGLPSYDRDLVKFQTINSDGTLKSESYGKPEWDLTRVGLFGHDTFDLLSVEQVSDNEAVWVVRGLETNTTQVLRSQLSFDAGATSEHQVFYKKYYDEDITPFFAKSAPTSD